VISSEFAGWTKVLCGILVHSSSLHGVSDDCTVQLTAGSSSTSQALCIAAPYAAPHAVLMLEAAAFSPVFKVERVCCNFVCGSVAEVMPASESNVVRLVCRLQSNRINKIQVSNYLYFQSTFKGTMNMTS
jgi:hypothetical protein